MTAAIATAESVKNAVAELRAAGINPTGEALIKHLGGGSKSTVLLHLRQLLKDETTPSDVLPLALIDQVRPALAELFKAGAAAEGEKSRARLERQERLLDEMEQLLIDLEAERQKLRHEFEKLSSRCSEMESLVASREAELKAALEQLAHAREQTAAGIAQLLARVESSVETLATMAVAPS